MYALLIPIFSMRQNMFTLLTFDNLYAGFSCTCHCIVWPNSKENSGNIACNYIGYTMGIRTVSNCLIS